MSFQNSDRDRRSISPVNQKINDLITRSNSRLCIFEGESMFHEASSTAESQLRREISIQILLKLIQRNGNE